MNSSRPAVVSNEVKMSSSSRDILVLSENKLGRDFIVGDIHGSIKQLTILISLLKDNDRLIIVGDLTDRGPGSYAVVKAIGEYNFRRKNKNSPRIYVVRGNHEDIFLDYFHGSRDENSHLLHPGIGGSWVLALTEAQKKWVADFFSSLPYIIHVVGENPFNVVHADMPFTDDMLFEKILAGQRSLSAVERQYATWARTAGTIPIQMIGRTSNSILTYCGHSIGEGVRIATNHLNLDVGTYSSDCLCIVNHQESSVDLIGDIEKQDYSFGKKTALAVKNEIQMHLKFKAAIQTIIKIDKIADMNDDTKNKNIYLKLLNLPRRLGEYGKNKVEIYSRVLMELLPDLQPSTRLFVSKQLKSITVDETKNTENKPDFSTFDKIKKHDDYLVAQALKYSKESGCHVREGYLQALREVTLIPNFFSNITREQLGDYLKAAKNHILLEKDSARMFADSLSEEVSLSYLNKALQLLKMSPITSLVINEPEYIEKLRRSMS